MHPFFRVLFVGLIIAPLLFLPEVHALFGKIPQKHKFSPQTIITLYYKGRNFKVPYGYIYDDGKPELHADGVNILKYPYSPHFQYLWPSYTPVPKGCDEDTPTCDKPAIKGFDAPPKGQKQTAIFHSIYVHDALDLKEENRNFIMGEKSIREHKERGKYQVLTKINLEELQFGNGLITYYRSLDPEYLHLYIHCVTTWCVILAADPDKSWTHVFKFNRTQLGQWRQIYDGRKRILEMFPPH